MKVRREFFMPFRFLWKSRELVGLCKKNIILNDRRAKKKKTPQNKKPTQTTQHKDTNQPTNNNNNKIESLGIVSLGIRQM